MKNLSTEKRYLFSEVIKLIKIILIVTATNAISERIFSTLKRVKTSIRSIMTDSRLKHLHLIHIYKEELDEIHIKLITDEFIKIKESRLLLLGCINFEHLFVLVHILLLLNSFLLSFLPIPPEIIRKS